MFVVKAMPQIISGLILLAFVFGLSGCYLRLDINGGLTTSSGGTGGSGGSGGSGSNNKPELRITQPSQVLEGGLVEFAVELTAPIETPLTFHYQVNDGTATSNVDFTPVSGTITIPAGQTRVVISVPTVNRSGYQGNRNLVLQINNINGEDVTPTQATAVIEEINLVPGMVKNLNRNSLDFEHIKVGNKVFFVGDDDEHGQEIWVTDGTPAGTKMVLDIFPGPNSSSITQFFAMNDIVYFAASDSVHGREVWRSDGTATGTYMVSDTLPGADSGDFIPSLAFNGSIIFSTFSRPGGQGQQIWKLTPGAPEQVSFLFGPPINIYTPVDAQYKFTSIVVLDNALYFEGRLSTCGDICRRSGLYKSDGTVAGTVLLKDLSQGLDHSIYWLQACGSKLYFGTSTSGLGTNDQFWVSDGTSAGTVIAKTIGTSSVANSAITCGAGGKMFEWAMAFTTGTEPYVTDGTTEGTILLKDIETGVSSSYAGLDFNKSKVAIPFKAGMVFSAQDSIHGHELWYSDGTSAGTVLLKDIEPGNTWPSNWDAKPGQTVKPNSWITFNNELYFYAGNQASGVELWKTDGTPAGTVIVKDIYPGPTSSFPHGFIEFNGQLLFMARDADHGQDLWRTDGTLEGTRVFLELNQGAGNSAFANLMTLNNDTLLFTYVKNNFNGSTWALYNASTQSVMDLSANPVPDEGMDYSFLFRIGKEIFFSGDDGSWGTKIYKTDLTNSGTGLFFELAPNGGCSNIQSLGGFRDYYYFVAETPEAGKEIWRTDGTSLGTMLFKEIVPGSAGVRSVDFVGELNNQMILEIKTPIEGTELWSSDGTSSGTQIITDLFPGIGNGYVEDLYLSSTTTPQILYFYGCNGTVGCEIFKTDGSSPGTALVADLNAGAGSSGPKFQGMINGKVVLTAIGDNGNELYFINNGVVTTKDLYSGAVAGPELIAEMNGFLYFAASGNGVGRELYRTDGTSSGTTLVKDVVAGALSSQIDQHTRKHAAVTGTKIFFNAYNQASGIEPWVSDGTAAGTHVLREFASGVSGSGGYATVYSHIVFNDRFYFQVKDSVTGVGTELFVSDGTTAGTELFRDFEPGSGSSITYALTDFKNELYMFVVAPSQPGFTLWKTDGTQAGTVLVKRFADIKLSSSNFELIKVVATGTNVFYFSVATDTGYQVWKSDGTTEGTTLPVITGNTTSTLRGVANFYLFEDDTLVFTGVSGQSGEELYVIYPN